jgi:hypothetical protein
MYLPKRSDGLGATMQNIITAAAYAAHRGWNFGGVWGMPHRSHGVDGVEFARFFMGDFHQVFKDYKVRDELGQSADVANNLGELMSLNPSSPVVFYNKDSFIDLVR